MLYDSNGFKPYIFYYFHNLSMYHTHTYNTHTKIYIYIYILLALRQNPLDIKFLYNFRNCQGNFHRTCPTPGPDMSGYRVSQIYKGDLIPFGTLASFFHPISSVCGGWALPR
jgi:hypothetical protein